MNAFIRIPRDIRQDQVDRERLLGQPPEFFRAVIGKDPTLMERFQCAETLIRTLSSLSVFVNDTYRVRLRNASPFVHIAISRRDDQPGMNWRDFQRIKSELVGAEREAVGLFPAESRLLDTSNEYHLYVMADAQYRFPFGCDRMTSPDDVPLIAAKPQG